VTLAVGLEHTPAFSAQVLLNKKSYISGKAKDKITTLILKIEKSQIITKLIP
jgi:hypothetical protein